jgi:hypothetical protein
MLCSFLVEGKDLAHPRENQPRGEIGQIEQGQDLGLVG